MNRSKAIFSALPMVAGIVGFAASLMAGGVVQALTNEEIANYKGADRAKVLLEGAKKEGKVVYYTGMTINQGVRPLKKAFEERYPGITLEFWRGAAPAMMQKIFAEAKAGKPIGDLAEGGNMGQNLKRAKRSQSFWSPVQKEYDKHYMDPEGYWTGTRLGYYGLAYNTKQVSDADAPKTYDDLLDPKWKGKIAWRVGADSGALTFMMNIMTARGDKAGEAYFRKLAENDLIPYKQSAGAMADRVGQGEFPMAVNVSAHHPVIKSGKGAPLALQLMDPVPVNVSPLVLVENAPHPHAAMLLIDFIISKEGQQVLSGANYFSPRDDVDPKGAMMRATPKAFKVKASVTDPAAFLAKRKQLTDIIEKYFH